MTDAGPARVHDDRAWPRNAGPISLITGLAAVATGSVVAMNQNRPLVGFLCLLAGLLAGSSLIVAAIRRWLSGRSIPAALGLVAGLITVGGLVALNVVAGFGAGTALVLGLVGGCMLANAWAVRAARANRPRASP